MISMSMPKGFPKRHFFFSIISTNRARAGSAQRDVERQTGVNAEGRMLISRCAHSALALLVEMVKKLVEI